MTEFKNLKKRRWGKKTVIALVLAGVGIAVALSRGSANASTEGDKKDEIKTAKVEKGDVQVRVTEVGSVEPQVKVDVKSVLSGKVVALHVREGDRVRRGQVLAEVEPDPSQARDLAQVKNSVRDADIAFDEARQTNDRNEGLHQQGLLSVQAALESETRFKAAKAARDAAMERYKIIEESGVPMGLVQSGISTRRLNVTAPMDGVVIRRPVELGDTVTSGVSSFNAGTVIATVADLGSMIIKAGINEVDIGKVRVGQEVKVSLDAFPKTRFGGHVARIAPAARIEDKIKVFDIEVALSKDESGAPSNKGDAAALLPQLRTGMTSNLDVIGDKVASVIAVPVEGIFRKDDQEIVYVKKPEAPTVVAKKGFFSSVFAAEKSTAPAKVDEKDRWKEKFEARVVETGLSSFDKVEIVKGLQPGDVIAVEDPTRPKEKKKDN